MNATAPSKLRAAALATALAVLLGVGLAAPAQAQLRFELRLGGGEVPAATALALPYAVAQSGECLSNPEIQQAVVTGQIMPLASVLAAAGIGQNAQVLGARVCRTGQGPVYFLSVIGQSGQARNIALNAVNGSPYSGQ